VDRCPADDFDQVGVENIESTAALSGHLAEIGHTRIGMISGVAGIRTTVERLEGYQQGLQAAGIDFDPALEAPGMSDATGASAAVRRLLSTPRPPTAVVIGNNHMTIGAMRELRARGIRVPEDLAVVTFDDFDWADVFSPRLTAIAQPIRTIAARAVELLFARIRGGADPVTTEHFPGIWRHRDSCGCSAAASTPAR
jgi:LacI family transcriptional regulator